MVLLVLAIDFGNDLLIKLENDQPSRSVGTTKDGSLINGKRLPSQGSNFVAYSYTGALLGRNCVNNRVRDIVLDAYNALSVELPDKSFMYGETGWCSGGRIRPHVTHRNGLSVDFFVPVINEQGQTVTLPTYLFNKFGYAVEFDEGGKAGDLRIDFATMATHLLRLQSAARAHNAEIEVVIFDSKLQESLFETETGQQVKDAMRFSKQPAWVRHDEHYHVDFKLN